MVAEYLKREDLEDLIVFFKSLPRSPLAYYRSVYGDHLFQNRDEDDRIILARYGGEIVTAVLVDLDSDYGKETALMHAFVSIAKFTDRSIILSCVKKSIDLAIESLAKKGKRKVFAYFEGQRLIEEAYKALGFRMHYEIRMERNLDQIPSMMTVQLPNFICREAELGDSKSYILKEEVGDEYDRLVSWIEDRLKKNRCIIAKTGDQIIGRIWLNPKDDAVDVYDFAVNPEFRRKGVGTALMLSAMQYSKAQGYQRTTLGVAPENRAAMNLYNKFAFKNVGKEPSGYRYWKQLQ